MAGAGGFGIGYSLMHDRPAPLLLLLIAALPAAGRTTRARSAGPTRWCPAWWWETRSGWRLPPGASSSPSTRRRRSRKARVVIVHGIGVHPDHGVIGVLRAKLTDLGWTTLSIQMPVQAADARSEAYYPALFPESLERIAARPPGSLAKEGPKVAIVSHSLGVVDDQRVLRRGRAHRPSRRGPAWASPAATASPRGSARGPSSTSTARTTSSPRSTPPGAAASRSPRRRRVRGR